MTKQKKAMILMGVMWLGLLIIGLLYSSVSDNEVQGRVTELTVDEETGVVTFVVQSATGKDIGLIVTDETSIYSFIDGVDDSEFITGAYVDSTVVVEYGNSRHSLTTQNGEEMRAYETETIYIESVLTTETATVSDGTILRIWRNNDSYDYELEDGTEILRVHDRSDPDSNVISRVENFAMLDAVAQQNISSFYEKQGLLYDIQTELEKAYLAYIQREDMTKYFACHVLEQTVKPSASSETVMYFVTSVQLPLGDRNYHTHYESAAFDKTTGNEMNIWDVFSCSPEEAKRGILDAVGYEDTVLVEKMMQAFEPEYIQFKTDDIEVYFPQGSLSGEEHSLGFGLAYAEIAELLHDWAIPMSSDWWETA